MRKLTSLSRVISKIIYRQIAPIFPEYAKREDAPESLIARFAKVAIGIKVAVPTTLPEMLAGEIFDRLNAFNEDDLREQIGIDLFDDSLLSEQRDSFIAANVARIRGMSEDQIARAESIMQEAAIGGLRVEEIQEKFQDMFDISEARAAFIARDQVLKGNAALTEYRQTRVGIKRYTWSTSGDERVRESHQALDGQDFDWDDPPIASDDGERYHPGEDYQCRCVPVPILDEDVQDEAAAVQESTPSGDEEEADAA